MKGGGEVAANQSGGKVLLGDIIWAKHRSSLWWPAQMLKQNFGCCHEIFQKALNQEHLQLKSGKSVGAGLQSKDMNASKDKKSNQSQGKKNMGTGASNHLSDAADVYHGRGVGITRAMKADMKAKSPYKNVSGKGEAKKISSLNNGLSVMNPPRKSGNTKQDGQQKKQKAATSAAKQCFHVVPEQDKVLKKHKPSPSSSSYEPSARQMRVLRSLGLAAPLGSPFRKR